MSTALQDRRALSSADTAVEMHTGCRHCGLPVVPGLEFCCPGCAGAFGLIHSLGLAAYYGRRDSTPAVAAAAALESRSIEDGTIPALADAVEIAPDGACSLRLRLDGLTCGACVWLVETAMTRQSGVVSARVNLTTRRLTLRWIGDANQADRLAETVRKLGYRPALFDASAGRDPQARTERQLLRAVALSGFASMNIMLLSVSIWSGHAGSMGDATRTMMHWLSALIALPAVLYAGIPFYQSAWAALRAGRTNMDVPISVGVILTCGISLWETLNQGRHAYFDGAVMLLFFLLIGRYLDSVARGRARSAAEHLLALSQAPVTVVGADGVARSVAPSAVPTNACVLVASGERIGVDGTVVQGCSDLDTSIVTGETQPQPVSPGSPVFAGMLNLSAPLRLTVTAAGEGTLLAEIVRLMEAAEQGRARFVVIADRIARYYTPVVHIAALLTFLVWNLGLGLGWQPALLIAAAVLIITCPCALALAVPTVQVVASDRLMRQGVLLKSATALERLSTIDTIVFDKTGTLTLGRAELQPGTDWDSDDLACAARLARASRHPLSRALARAAGPGPVADGVVEIAGRGLELQTGQGLIRLGSRSFIGLRAEPQVLGDGPELWLSRPGMAARRFSFADRTRSDAASVVAGLKKAGYAIELLSGDRPGTVAALATSLGIQDWRAGVDPAGKCVRLAELRRSGRRVLMVGDGLNDAAALAAADVSVAPASAVDIAQTAADAVFQGDRLAPLAELLRTARRAERLVQQNLWFTLLYNLLAVPVAMLGLATPLIASIAMASSSLAVMGNALRLSYRPGKGSQS
jgi:P-type Cu2+ transporter